MKYLSFFFINGHVCKEISASMYDLIIEYIDKKHNFSLPVNNFLPFYMTVKNYLEKDFFFRILGQTVKNKYLFWQMSYFHYHLKIMNKLFRYVYHLESNEQFHKYKYIKFLTIAKSKMIKKCLYMFIK